MALVTRILTPVANGKRDGVLLPALRLRWAVDARILCVSKHDRESPDGVTAVKIPGEIMVTPGNLQGGLSSGEYRRSSINGVFASTVS
jgi:hypothetical protein